MALKMETSIAAIRLSLLCDCEAWPMREEGTVLLSDYLYLYCSLESLGNTITNGGSSADLTFSSSLPRRKYIRVVEWSENILFQATREYDENMQ